MCISSTTSFVASGILATTGIVTLLETRNNKQIPFAAIPFLFSVQQFSEGIVWLNMYQPEHPIRIAAIHVFLFFAQIVWPVFVPWSLYILEKHTLRKQILMVCLCIGALFSIYLSYGLFYYPTDAVITDYHIHYLIDVPNPSPFLSGTAYFIPTVLSLFISSIPRIKILGWVILISYVLTGIFFKDTLVSVWCFFAAIGSITIYYILKGSEKNKIRPTGFTAILYRWSNNFG